jgi:hypothetical protein
MTEYSLIEANLATTADYFSFELTHVDAAVQPYTTDAIVHNYCRHGVAPLALSQDTCSAMGRVMRALGS